MGKVYLVGAGPGDPELITLKGLKAIQNADVILYDRLVHPSLLDYKNASAQLVYCGKKPDAHSLDQTDINALLRDLALEDKTVTRLKGGDPFIFGRGGEEAAVLAEYHIPFEVVPGITSGAAAPAYAGIPVTQRHVSSSVTFVSGVTGSHIDDDTYWAHLAAGEGTLCVYMGVKNLPDICRRLTQNGKAPETPVALVHSGTTDSQLTVTGTLSDIVTKASEIKNPAMIIIGEVVRFREKINWFETKGVSLVQTGQN